MINTLFTIIKKRQKELPAGSYIASLFNGGRDRIAQKVGEEAVEVIIAAKSESKKRQIAETADLWFHLLVLMADLRITPKDVFAELEKRRNAKEKK